MKAVVAAFNQEKALVGAFSVITNLRICFGWNFLKHYLEGLQGDRPQRARDLDLLQLGPEGPEQLVRENVRGLQDLGLERLEGGEAGDDGAQAELELLYLRPALDVEGGEVSQLGQGVRVEPLEVGQVVHHEALQAVEAVEALLGEDPEVELLMNLPEVSSLTKPSTGYDIIVIFAGIPISCPLIEF